MSEPFERARILNRSVRAESKLDVSARDVDELYKSHMRSKWQSVGALTEFRSSTLQAGNNQQQQQQLQPLNRLKKSYATMRKSFRVQLTDRKRRFNFSNFATQTSQSTKSDSLTDANDSKTKSSANLIGQIGSSAVKLFRGVYSKSSGQHYSRDINQFDSCAQSTNGSFKVLSPYQDESMNDNSSSPTKKSIAEQEIEQRLRRSKRRTLPSAQYKAPDCEHACDDLDLDQLEAIKRDNLRLTLRSVRATEEPTEPANQEEICTCKSVEDDNDLKIYCSCLSLESSVDFSMENRAEDFRWSVELTANEADKDTKKLPTTTSDEPRASGGFEGQEFEDELEKMLVGLLKAKTTTETIKQQQPDAKPSRQNSFRLAKKPENVCGRAVVSQSSPTTTTTAAAAGEFEKLRGSKFRVIDGDPLPLPSESEHATVELCKEMNDEQQQQQQSNCCKLGGVDSAEGVSQAATTAGKAEMQSSSSRTAAAATTKTDSDHRGHSKKRNSFSGAATCATTLTCSGGKQAADGVKVRALSVVATDEGDDDDDCDCNDDGETKFAVRRARSLSRRDAASGKTSTEREMNHQQQWHQFAMGPEEHLYASINCAAAAGASPSPERYHQLPAEQYVMRYDDARGENFYYYDDDDEQDQAASCWREYETMIGRQDLFDKQLNHRPADATESTMTLKKKSIFGRIKQLIVPTTTSKSTACAGSELPQAWDYVDHSQRQGKMSSSSSTMRMRHKSATLSSRSTHNLLASSMRYLSTSRKSINHAAGDSDCEEDGSPARKSSFMNGFLTLGRRSNKYGLNKHQSVSQIFSNNSPASSGGSKQTRNRSYSMAAGKRRTFGSADSLAHSADSGLSCSNLQTNSASSSDENNYIARANDNVYSEGPSMQGQQQCNEREVAAYSAEEEEGEMPAESMVVVGRAIAKVDCNPCAYDKEALVFKRGDLIDILERDQSGSWIGQCNGQIGHFKFINVTEIPMEGDTATATDTDESETSTIDDDDGGEETDREEQVGDACGERKEAVFITKLVIKSTGVESAVAPESGEKDQQQRSNSLTESSSSRRGRRRSLSVDTIDPIAASSTGAATDKQQKLVSDDNCLSNSNETITGSLEQLLFAIGLAEERVLLLPSSAQSAGTASLTDNNQQQQQLTGADGKEREREAASLSYLNVLNGKGINSLDSFSAIDHCHELEQIGIIDDEHKRRLLMAARIIRQASQAAKLDFVQNHSTSSAKTASSSCCSHRPTDRLSVKGVTSDDDCDCEEPNSIALRPEQTPAVRVVETKTKRSATAALPSPANGARNEPVYVNLVRAGSSSFCFTEPPSKHTTFTCNAARDNNRILAATRRERGSEYPTAARQQRRSRLLAHPSQSLDEIIETGNQSRQMIAATYPITATATTTTTTTTTGSETNCEVNPINQSNQDHYHMSSAPRRRPSLSQRTTSRQSMAAAHRNSSSSSGHQYIEHEHQAPRLMRGYSIRPDIGTFARQQQKFIGQPNQHAADLSGYQQQQQQNYHHQQQQQFRRLHNNNNYQINHRPHPNGGQVHQQLAMRKQQQRVHSRESVVNKQQPQQPMLLLSGNLSTQSRSQMMIMNSKSAYDLRFDLAHFFT